MDFEQELRGILEQKLCAATENVAHSKTPGNLAESIRYSLLAPGKRIRPRLVRASSSLFGIAEKSWLPLAAAIEMIHCFTLIHDDLPCMDDDDFRRGMPSNHKKFGEAIALLAGDALLALGYETFCDAAGYFPSSCFSKALRRFHTAVGPRGVLGGQAEEALLLRKSSFELLREMFAKKTGALFTLPILAPMDLAGVDESSSDARTLKDFARELGFAFQVADDLEDILDIAPATHILHYWSRAEAIEKTGSALQQATESVAQIWRGNASELVDISTEVQRKLRSQARA